MPKPKALNPFEARQTFVHRFGKRVNRLRQIPVRFGLRPYRTFLVWFRWTGMRPGEGELEEIARREIIPTPTVTEAPHYLFMDVGRSNQGDMKLLRVDPTLDEQFLRGYLYSVIGGGGGSGNGPGNEDCPNDGEVGYTVDDTGHPLEFYYLIREDGRSRGTIVDRWFILRGQPYREAGHLTWNVELERVDR